ncbi:flagellar assembly protein FliH [Acidithiobacillus sp. CV18-2]|uniref:Flagellar assembly protein FliH n=1 Tax=Igneacidithiobacillus copahuensis TaxID=2724909 RepID=A0AAE2YP69_9PROT|nr:FliH/SctL family protein [Igneacidithiobacillus copahuensis]MBU2754386.1 flagellar assembly protein FliH [Acidithiobacillus sp. CV18-3]MBU2757591.1 flagellar assembly protein FliH [Acidithiobacillus sp. BN09-2]MBU2777094.1 flagellar assembly protein FliH [Acidithiobacillus sp. CV18-2]MBU2797407.1 flagellar assembly protein FliH [Acidithiobacillus sp. VAN18-2]MBU2799755.1 flagellar assembly protein FliH [Acidithiobacillus sp. VAN18-4]UTV81921.1 flagellar assembly protein FliH [Acidithiobaci
MADSDADVIQRETIANLRAWRMPQMSGIATATSAQEVEENPPAEEAGEEVEPQDLRLPTAEALQKMVAQAEEEGRQRGREEGYAAGRAEGLQAARKDIETFRQLVEQLAVPVEQLSDGVEQALLALALELARQVIRQELQTHPEQILPLLREALVSVPIAGGAAVLRLHPQDCALVEEQLPELVDAGVTLAPDEALERGSLIVQAGLDMDSLRPDRRWRERSEASATELDLRLATRWRQVLDTLFAGIEA